MNGSVGRRAGGARRLPLATVLGTTLAAVVLVAACSSSATPTPDASTQPVPSAAPSASVQPSSAVPSLAPTPTARATTGPTAAPSATTPTPAPVTPAPTGSWVAAGSMPADWFGGPVVALPGGGALAIARDGSAVARWDPSTATWTKGKGLATPRWNFAAVPLQDGRVLVVGGANDTQQAYSSAWVYDGRMPAGSWSKVGLMSTARSEPSAALLQDGRVLVAGGAYFDRPSGGVAPDAVGSNGLASAVLAAFQPGAPARTGGRSPLSDVAPSHTVPALATAELFDPGTGTFSRTGSMQFARAGAVATTLSDGRVLLVSPGGELWVGSDVAVYQDQRAASTPEVYDPSTGRFSLVGSLPPIARAAIAADGVEVPTTDPWMTSTGTLVALQDGGALLVGHDVSWKHEADVVRTFRFDGRTSAWTQVGAAFASGNDWASGTQRSTPATDVAGSFVAPLPDGRVLAAGGVPAIEFGWKAATIARAFDPATNGWADLPSMPTARVDGATAALTDGSVLLVGGDWSDSGGQTAVRYVPGR
jgi:hypothetical protein